MPQRDELLRAALDPTASRAQVTRIELGPGEAAGLHSHPCDVVGYVVAGTIRFQVEGGDEQVLEAGAAFHEPKDARIARFDNASASEPAVFIACYLLAPGEERTIEML